MSKRFMPYRFPAALLLAVALGGCEGSGEPASTTDGSSSITTPVPNPDPAPNPNPVPAPDPNPEPIPTPTPSPTPVDPGPSAHIQVTLGAAFIQPGLPPNGVTVGDSWWQLLSVKPRFEPVTVNSVSISGPHFRLTNDDCSGRVVTVDEPLGCRISVGFGPAEEVGLHKGQLRFETDGGPYIHKLEVTVVAPDQPTIVPPTKDGPFPTEMK